MKTILLLSLLFTSPLVAQTKTDTTAQRNANVQASQQRAQPKIDTVYIVQQPIYQQPVYQQPYQQPYHQPQRVENEYSMSSGTQVLYVVLIGLAMIPLLFLL